MTESKLVSYRGQIEAIFQKKTKTTEKNVLKLECVQPNFRSERKIAINRCSILNWEEMKEKKRKERKEISKKEEKEGGRESQVMQFKASFFIRKTKKS